MAFVVTGSPVQGVVDAMKTALTGDATLMAILTTVTGHVVEQARPTYPYLVLGRRGRGADAGAFGIAGTTVSVELDWWSNHRGPYEAQTIGGHLSRILQRAALAVPGFDVVAGSLTCEFEDIYEEPDDDMPNQKLYRGVQRWTAEIHERA
jgi:hypothetical protein